MTMTLQMPRRAQRTQQLIAPRSLTLEELREIITHCEVPATIENEFLVLRKSSRGATLKTPVQAVLAKVLAVREKGLVTYILESFASTRPSLIPTVFENMTLVRMARHFLRYCSGSRDSLYAYTDDAVRYSRFLDSSPDMIISDAKSGGNIPDAIKVQNHTGFLEDYLAQLQDDGLSPGRVHGAVKHVRTFYRTNGIEIKLQEQLKPLITCNDRAPTPEELSRIWDLADLRERVIISLLALGGFREATLAALKYRHIREDLEKGQVPIHVHVESDIVKAHYASYHTFLGGEAAEALRLYMDERRNGSPDGRLPPEELTDQSPLIRDVTSHVPRSIGKKAVARIVRNIYARGEICARNLSDGSTTSEYTA